MLEKLGRIRLLYIVLGVLLLVGLLPLAFAGFLLSGRSADELRSIEGRYQAQLVQDKARQIELYGQRYRDVVTGLARAFEISGGIQALDDSGYDQRLQKTLQEDPNLIALALWPVDGTLAPRLPTRGDQARGSGRACERSPGPHEWTRSRRQPATDHPFRTGDGADDR